MPPFAKNVPRWTVLACALAFFALVSPETLGRGPDLCLLRHIFHLSACPACGTTRALAAIFHGDLRQALAFNANVLVTAPLLLGLLLDDLRRAVGKPVKSRRVKELKS